MSDNNEMMDSKMEENTEEIKTDVTEIIEESKADESAPEKEEISQEEISQADISEDTATEESASEKIEEPAVESANEKVEEPAVEAASEKVEETVAETTTEQVEESGDGNGETGKKKVIPVKSIVAILAVIVVIALVVLLSGMNKGVTGDTYRISSKAVGYEYGVLFNQKAETKLWEENGLYVKNFDGSALVYVLADSNDKKTEYELWYTNSSLETVKMDTVSSGGGVYQVNISDDGKYVVYVIDNGGDVNQNADVHIYNVARGESTIVAKDVYPYSVVASPDCKTVAYISDYDNRDDNKLFLAGLNKEAVKIAKDGCIAKAVTNNGKSVIYTNFVEDKLYYYNGKESVKISADVDANKFFINCSEDEIVYMKDGKTYCYKAGDAEANKLSSNKVYYFASSSIKWSTENVNRLSIATFADAVFVDYDYKLCMITDKKDDVVKIAASCEDFSISADGSSMVYGDGDELYLVKKLSGTPEGEVIYTSEDIVAVITNSNLSKIYIVNDDDELIYVTKSGKHEMISNDVDDIRPVLCESNGKIYYVEDGDLYEAGTNKKSRTLVKSDVVEIKSALTGICYMTEEGNIGFIF